jgi:hypothetical protein
MLDLFIEIILRGRLILILWNRLAGHTVLALNPPAEIY